jgi:hypothetical protein
MFRRLALSTSSGFMSTLMTVAELVSDMLVFNLSLTWLIARENLKAFIAMKVSSLI